ncbi:MAG: TolC family protein [Bacteroidota bacterium]|nr:TolC family protein [Bacteroidota bacterium]
MISVILLPGISRAQQGPGDSVLQDATLKNCIQYAIKNNPAIKNAGIDEDIVDATIKSKLADWYPQLSFNYDIQYYFKLPTLNFGGNLIHTGTKSNSLGQFEVTQNIFNRDALLASRSERDVRRQANQTTSQQKINLAVAVSKAFYDVILTRQQIALASEDIARLQQSLKDAYYQYQSGITDKTDYKRATISLNNAKALQKQEEEALVGKDAYLKELLGYPASAVLSLSYDTAALTREINIDTTQTVNYDNRIEVKLLETQRKLQSYNLLYYKWSYLPVVSAFGYYNLNFLNNQISKLYNAVYPNSYAGISLTFPIFQGGKRIQQIRQAHLELDQVDNSIKSLENSINTEYLQALSTYKSNLDNYYMLKDNMDLAKEVYGIISLQYRAGVKTYLDVISAETDLRAAEINYYNALYQVLSSKVDVMKSLGTLTY